MLTRLVRATLPAVLACTLGLQPAYADLYTWVNASGGVNVSNLAPPEGVRIINVIPASPTATHDAREAARDAEVQALTKRVRQLEEAVASQGSGSNYWYYCPNPAGYYPDVQTCPEGWLQVVPNRPSDPTAGAAQ
jgi:Spy/CpxP family protein refolding chaperone